MRKINIKTLHEAAPLRLPGYIEAVRARGRVEGDVIILSYEDFDELRRQYQMPGITAETPVPVAKLRLRSVNHAHNPKMPVSVVSIMSAVASVNGAVNRKINVTKGNGNVRQI